MANLKNITELPVAESAEGLNLIVNDNGAAKQIAASAVGAQADWAETDETSAAFIKNKPEVVQADWSVEDSSNPAFIKNKPGCDAVITVSSVDDDHIMATLTTGSYEALAEKIQNGEMPKILFTGEMSYGEMYNVSANAMSAYYEQSTGNIWMEVRLCWYNWRAIMDNTGTIMEFLT